MKHPPQRAFRAIATIMAAVFPFDGLFEPAEIDIEDARPACRQSRQPIIKRLFRRRRAA